MGLNMLRSKPALNIEFVNGDSTSVIGTLRSGIVNPISCCPGRSRLCYGEDTLTDYVIISMLEAICVIVMEPQAGFVFQ